MGLANKFLNGTGLSRLVGKIKNYVKPNPTLAGTESALTGLEVDGTKYKVFPAVTSTDEGKFLRVNSSGEWVAETVQTWQGGSY